MSFPPGTTAGKLGKGDGTNSLFLSRKVPSRGIVTAYLLRIMPLELVREKFINIWSSRPEMG
jgi:hypothetical protein